METSMNMNFRGKFVLTVIALGIMVIPATFAAGAHDDDSAIFRARLTSFGEVPPKLTDGKGRFTGKLSADGNSISWTLTWSGLTGPAQMAHIHFGQPQNTGSVVVFFCGGGGRPACPDDAGHSGSISGTWTAADILGVPGQNVMAGDFAGFKRILSAHLGYANIHTHPYIRMVKSGDKSVLRIGTITM